MREYQFLLPTLREQVEIGRTLKVLDDKIANNIVINHNLPHYSQPVSYACG
jgi:hypothetical protein